MRALIHPSIDDITLEGILHALADPVRAAIYADLAVRDGAATCSAFVNVIDREIPKSTLSQHFRALREAGLIRSERAGVEMHSHTRCKEIEQRFPGLIPSIMKAYAIESGAKPKRKTAKKTRSG
ncbi:MAG TPA: helix-turn-helix domain-containing protein [Rhodanobacteraceae bacterium]|nr:helix-turn-helix domain-containing protein [Rhodanobacteraceae bacterium]